MELSLTRCEYDLKLCFLNFAKECKAGVSAATASPHGHPALTEVHGFFFCSLLHYGGHRQLLQSGAKLPIYFFYCSSHTVPRPVKVQLLRPNVVLQIGHEYNEADTTSQINLNTVVSKEAGLWEDQGCLTSAKPDENFDTHINFQTARIA